MEKEELLPAVGTRWVWEVDKPDARALVEVTEVKLQGHKAEWWVKTRSLLPAQHEEKAGMEHWNELSRFYEACSSVGRPALLKPLLTDELGNEVGDIQKVAQTDKGVYFTALIKDGVPSMGYFGPGDIDYSIDATKERAREEFGRAVGRAVAGTLGEAAEMRAQVDYDDQMAALMQRQMLYGTGLPGDEKPLMHYEGSDELIQEKVPIGSMWWWRQTGKEVTQQRRVAGAWIGRWDKHGYVETEDPTVPEYDRKSTRYRHRYADFIVESTRVEDEVSVDEILGDLVRLLNSMPHLASYFTAGTMKAARDYASKSCMTTNTRWADPALYETMTKAKKERR